MGSTTYLNWLAGFLPSTVSFVQMVHQFPLTEQGPLLAELQMERWNCHIILGFNWCVFLPSSPKTANMEHPRTQKWKLEEDVPFKQKLPSSGFMFPAICPRSTHGKPLPSIHSSVMVISPSCGEDHGSFCPTSAKLEQCPKGAMEKLFEWCQGKGHLI